MQVPDFQRAESSRVLELQGSRAPGLQDSKVAGFHGFKVTKLQESKVAGSTVSEEFLVGSFAGTFPDTLTKFADLV